MTHKVELAANDVIGLGARSIGQAIVLRRRLLPRFVRLGPGEWVIQNAANSAVGLYPVQLARSRPQDRRRRNGRGRDRCREAGGDLYLVDGEDPGNRVTHISNTAMYNAAMYESIRQRRAPG